MQLGYIIIYVDHVLDVVAFYATAFGMQRRFVHESGQYAELQTGQTTLAFAARGMARAHIGDGVVGEGQGAPPGSIQVTLVTDDVAGALARAVAAGAEHVKSATQQPWGQTTAYVRSVEGTLVELATPMRETAPAGARHVLTILATADLAAARAFYAGAFGWPVRIDVPVFVEFALPDGRGLGVYQREAFAHNTQVLPASLPAGAVTGTELYLHCDDLSAQIGALERVGARLLSARAPRPWGDEAAYYADPDGNVVVVATKAAAPEA